MRRRTDSATCDEDGRVVAFLVVMVAALLLCAGLVLDGGNALAVKSRAIGVAEEAARAGAQQLDLALYRATGQARLDQAAAKASAQAFIEAAGFDGAAQATDDTVTVSVSGTAATQLLSVIGIDHLSVGAQANAQPLTGVDAPEP